MPDLKTKTVSRVSISQLEDARKKMRWVGRSGSKSMGSLDTNEDSMKDYMIAHTWGLEEMKNENSSEGEVLDIMERPHNQAPACDEMAGCSDAGQTGGHILNNKSSSAAQNAFTRIAITVQGRLQNHYSDALQNMGEINIHFDRVSQGSDEAYKILKSVAAGLVESKKGDLLLDDERSVLPGESIECVPIQFWSDLSDDGSSYEVEAKEDYSSVKAISVGEFLNFLEV